MAATQTTTAAARVAFEYPSFGLYQIARFCIVLATEMQSVAVGWQVYEITKRPLDLGLVGLAQFLPGILLFLVSGHVADRYDRRRLVVACYAAFAGCSALLFAAAVRSHAFGVSDLRGADFDRHRARVQWAGEPRAAAATCAGRAFSERGGVGVGRLSDSDNSWPVDRRSCVRGVSRAVGGVRAGDGVVAGGDGLRVSGSRLSRARGRARASRSAPQQYWRDFTISGGRN